MTSHPDPTLGGTFADDDIPSAQDAIAAYGRIGFGTSGYVPCPPGGDQSDGGNGEGGDAPDPGAEDSGIIEAVYR